MTMMVTSGEEETEEVVEEAEALRLSVPIVMLVFHLPAVMASKIWKIFFPTVIFQVRCPMTTA